jgi:outer membrane protein insertion porin family
MQTGRPDKITICLPALWCVCLLLLITSCRQPLGIYVLKTDKSRKDKPFIFKNNTPEVKGGKFTKEQLAALKSRLLTQIDDSAKVNVVDKFFLWHIYNKPPVFDTAYINKSAKNMEALLLHMGYYKASVTAKADTIIGRKNSKNNKQRRVTVSYTVEVNKPTLIDTVSYNMARTDLQELIMQHADKSLLKKDEPVTKAAVLGEISRLVDLLRSNGYYKFTADELKVRGDTSIEALISISDDPFAQLELLALAQQKKDAPKIKLAVVLNPNAPENRLKKYYINDIYILPDYRPGDKINSRGFEERVTKEYYIIKYHDKRFRSGLLSRNVFFKRGDAYNQTDYYKTLNSFTRVGAWQSVSIEIAELKDSSNLIDMIVQLLPASQFATEAALETSYSANSNTNNVSTANAGNLLGLSGNLSFTNRNLLKQGTRWTTALRAGIEFNLGANRTAQSSIINSNELALNNTFVLPRFMPRAIPQLVNYVLPRFLRSANVDSSLKLKQPRTLIALNGSLINRINLFNLQSINGSYGWNLKRVKRNGEFTIKPINIEFARLYNETQAFKDILNVNPFLRYSFNTALVAGASFGYTGGSTNIKHPNRQHSIKINIEESGFPLLGVVPIPLRQLGVFNKYLRQFAKADVEYINVRGRKKSSLVFRTYVGVGLASKQDTTLPFFKQYFGGGSNSMRGWPVRGIGRGSQSLAPYGSNNQFNDRTGDVQFETNLEYRYNITQLFSIATLKGALFADIGNVWNLRNSNPTGGTDSAQFKFKNMWRDMGINAGTGFRLDFEYFVIRFDFGFRFKRPELAYKNNGWKIPALSFNDVFQKLFTKGANEQYRRWRYENFNFTIGINYPF